MRKTFLALALICLASPAWAQPPQEVTKTDPTVHMHDGFYLRFGTGFGSHVESINMEGHDPGVTILGMSSVGELSFGYAVRPGLVLGFGTYGSTVITSDRSIDADNPMPPAEIMDEATDFNVFGPFIDYYFDARGGLHLSGSIGLATVRGVRLTSARIEEDEVALGPGFVMGFGYDWWVARQWSLGVLARLGVGVGISEDDSGVRWEHGVGAAPSLLFTATYN